MLIVLNIPTPKIPHPVTAAKTTIKARRYERMIRKSQKKIGAYQPVSYTTIYA